MEGETRREEARGRMTMEEGEGDGRYKKREEEEGGKVKEGMKERRERRWNAGEEESRVGIGKRRAAGGGKWNMRR